MGRAFPEVQQVAQHVAGRAPELIALTDAIGSVVTLRPSSGPWAERIARAVTVAFGGHGRDGRLRHDASARRAARSSRARSAARSRSGVRSPTPRAIRSPRSSPSSTACGCSTARSWTSSAGRPAGFARGSVLVEGSGPDAGRLLRLEIQNENLVALEDGVVRASVPDLITVVDADDRRGDRHRAACATASASPSIAFACDPIWRTPRGIETAGPRAFGYDFDYVPIEVLACGGLICASASTSAARTPTPSCSTATTAVLAWAKTPTTAGRHGRHPRRARCASSPTSRSTALASRTSCSGRRTRPTRVLERRRLQRVAVLRLGAPATRSVPPLLAWPDDLRRAVSAGEAIVGGGSEFDGREIAPFDRDAAARFLEARARHGRGRRRDGRVLARLGRARAAPRAISPTRCSATRSPSR